MSFTTLIQVGELRRIRATADGTNGAAELVVLDCRFDLTAAAAGRQAYLKTRIPGARFADLNQDLAAPPGPATGRHPLPAPETLAGRFAALGIGPGKQVVVYDTANGSFAARAWWLLRWLGHTRVAVLDGGFNAWVADGGELESGTPAGAGGALHSAAVSPETANDSSADASIASQFALPVRSDTVLSTAQVLLALQNPGRLLVDARAPERYAGTVEPIDPVAGHVPGAVNHPFATNLATDGRFLPPTTLRRLWQERLAGVAPQNAILMCGSGVTACHNLLALEVAGLTGAKLYAGSWSEWIRDPQRPVVRGSTP